MTTLPSRAVVLKLWYVYHEWYSSCPYWYLAESAKYFFLNKINLKLYYYHTVWLWLTTITYK